MIFSSLFHVTVSTQLMPSIRGIMEVTGVGGASVRYMTHGSRSGCQRFLLVY